MVTDDESRAASAAGEQAQTEWWPFFPDADVAEARRQIVLPPEQREQHYRDAKVLLDRVLEASRTANAGGGTAEYARCYEEALAALAVGAAPPAPPDREGERCTEAAAQHRAYDFVRGLMQRFTPPVPPAVIYTAEKRPAGVGLLDVRQAVWDLLDDGVLVRDHNRCLLLAPAPEAPAQAEALPADVEREDEAWESECLAMVRGALVELLGEDAMDAATPPMMYPEAIFAAVRKHAAPAGRESVADLRVAAANLSMKLTQIMLDPRYLGVFANAQALTGRYKGPTFTAEKAALDDALERFDAHPAPAPQPETGAMEALRDLLRQANRVAEDSGEWRWKDHACAECEGTIPKPGFRCARHAAAHLLRSAAPQQTEVEHG